MISKAEIIIGIDVGRRTGVAVWDRRKGQFLSIQTMRIDQATREVEKWVREQGDSLSVMFEDARLRRWYGSNASAKQQGAGSIKRDSTIWEEFLKGSGINYEAIHPKRIRTNLNAEQFKLWTGYSKRTSQHARDAAMIVFGIK